MRDIYVVIMAGGSGTRFWPFSREEKPKQFLDVLGTGQSLLQMTFERYKEITPVAKIYLASNTKYKKMIQEQLPEVDKSQLLLEPFQRNTAPCIAYACHKIAKKNADATIIVSPSDHVIFKEIAFIKLINLAIKAAEGGDKLVTVGVKPTRPETGYGYIQYIETTDSGVKKVKTFTEKPVKELAEKFVESGDFVWNAGIFIWSAKAIIKEFKRHLPEMAEIFSDITSEYYTKNEQAAVDKAYSLCKNISIDYGIMEKSDNVYVMPGEFGWSDLGSWRSLDEVSEKDTNNNMVKANAIIYNSKNCTISGPDDKLIVVSGLDNCLITAHGNAILVSSKDSETELKSIVHDIKVSKKNHFL